MRDPQCRIIVWTLPLLRSTLSLFFYLTLSSSVYSTDSLLLSCYSVCQSVDPSVSRWVHSSYLQSLLISVSFYLLGCFTYVIVSVCSLVCLHFYQITYPSRILELLSARWGSSWSRNILRNCRCRAGRMAAHWETDMTAETNVETMWGLGLENEKRNWIEKKKEE